MNLDHLKGIVQTDPKSGVPGVPITLKPATARADGYPAPGHRPRKAVSHGVPSKASNRAASGAAEHLEHLEHRTARNPVTPAPEPARPCADCGGCHWWRDTDGWHCSTCRPCPQPLQGEFLTLPGATVVPAPALDREPVNLPRAVLGIPLEALRQKGADDWAEIVSTPGLLTAFARACVASGTLQPRPAPFNDPDADLIGRPESDWVEPCLSPSPADMRRRQEATL